MPPKFRKRVPNLRRKAAQISTVTVGVRIEIVLGEVLRIRRLGTSPQWNYFQRNSCKLTIKVVQFISGCKLRDRVVAGMTWSFIGLLKDFLASAYVSI
ncbi:hypothetical protein ACS0TY_004164 [Phlomoides rotata]